MQNLYNPIVTERHDCVALDVFRVGGELEVLRPGAEPHSGYPAHPDEHAYRAVLGYGRLELLGEGPHLLLRHLARNLPTQHVPRALAQPSDHRHLPLVDPPHHVFGGQVRSYEGSIAGAWYGRALWTSSRWLDFRERLPSTHFGEKSSPRTTLGRRPRATAVPAPQTGWSR
jgi:hypothetical protein